MGRLELFLVGFLFAELRLGGVEVDSFLAVEGKICGVLLSRSEAGLRRTEEESRSEVRIKISCIVTSLH